MSYSVRFTCIAILACSVGIGCGDASRRQSKEIAVQTKQNIDDAVTQILESPDSAATNVAILIESLEAQARDYGGPFNKLLETAKSVQFELERSPDNLKVESELGRLTAAAEEVVNAM